MIYKNVEVIWIPLLTVKFTRHRKNPLVCCSMPTCSLMMFDRGKQVVQIFKKNPKKQQKKTVLSSDGFEKKKPKKQKKPDFHPETEEFHPCTWQTSPSTDPIHARYMVDQPLVYKVSIYLFICYQYFTPSQPVLITSRWYTLHKTSS